MPRKVKALLMTIKCSLISQIRNAHLMALIEDNIEAEVLMGIEK